jgi:hypothetical protein
MINHARTLLLNVSGTTSSREELGEEYIPETFAAFELPSYLQVVRRVLLGAAPDRYFLNCRARELMQLLHTTELAEYVYQLDTRVTYWPEQAGALLGSRTEITRAQNQGPASTKLLIFGAPRSNALLGRARYSYRISVETGLEQLFRVSIRTDDLADHYTEFNSSDVSPIINFPDTPLKLRVQNPQTGAAWSVTTTARPEPIITTLLPVLEILGEPVVLELFGVSTKNEPYATFRNLWFDHPLPVYRLAGLVLATIYRTDEVYRRTR